MTTVWQDDQVLTILDRGPRYGLGVFETIRVYDGIPRDLQRHIGRFRRSLTEIGLTSPNDSDLDALAQKTIKDMDGTSLCLRLFGWAGPENQSSAKIAGQATPFMDPTPSIYQEGVSVIWSSIRQSHTSPAARLKSISYMDRYLAWQHATKEGVHEAILLNDRNHIAEGTRSNIFWRTGKEVFTPSLDVNIVPGIVRGRVLELLQQEDVSIHEGEWSQDDFKSADEVFLTGSLHEIVPVVRVNAQDVGTGTPGPLATRLLERYREAGT